MVLDLSVKDSFELITSESKKLQQTVEAISKIPEKNIPDIINLYYQVVMVQTLAKKLKNDFESFDKSEHKKLSDKIDEIEKYLVDNFTKSLHPEILTQLTNSIQNSIENLKLLGQNSERRQIEFKDKTENLIKSLEVDETLGQLLVSEGLQSIDEISQSNPEDITKIEGIDEATAQELIDRSKENLIKEKEEISKRLKELGVEESLINLKGITQGMLVLLGQRNIKKLIDFADLSSDELIGGYDEIKGKKIRIEGFLEEFSLSREEADQLIMAAREIAYK